MRTRFNIIAAVCVHTERERERESKRNKQIIRAYNLSKTNV